MKSKAAAAARLLGESSETPLWTFETQAGQVTWVSPACLKLRGPGGWLERVHAEDRARVAEALKRLGDGVPFSEEYRVERPEGGVLWLHGRAFPIAGEECAVGTEEDVSARKQSEAAVRESENRLRALLEAASQAMVGADAGGRIRLVNRATEELFGYARAELLGHPLEVLLPESLRQVHERHRAGYFAHPRSRPMGIGLALAGRKKSGEEFPAEVSLGFLDEGPNRLALALITDISERRRFEEHLRDSSKLESLGVLAGGIAHDFNNILTSILGNASLALEVTGEGGDPRPMLEAVVEGSQRAAQLTSQMLAYSGKGRYSVGPVRLSSMMSETIGLMRRSIPGTVRLELHLADALPAIEADLAQLKQVAMNLVLNAVEAIGGRPGVVEVRTAPAHLSPEARAANLAGNDVAPGEYVALEVRDDGCGMDETTRGRMFDPFFTTKFTGRGLGLAATLGIVRGHHGALLVDTAPERGTTVTVLLPVTPSTAVARSAGGVFPSRVRGAVMVADTEAAVRKMAAEVLASAGYAVALAGSGEDAVRVVESHNPGVSVVLLDMAMSSAGGMDVLRRLRNLDPSARVILSSGHGEDEAASRFWGGNIAGFLRKPYTAAHLLEHVRAAFSGQFRR